MYGGAYMTGNEIDIRTVKREALPQLSSIAIDESQSPDDRAASFFRQLGGRLCYADDEMVISFGYADTDVKLTNKLAMYASSLG